MKKILLLTVILVSASVVFAQEMTKKEKKAAQKAEKKEKTKTLVASDAWQFDANIMLPSSGKSQTLTTSYNIVVEKEHINSYLPYFGRAYRADYGSTESPLIFEGEISDYKMEVSKKGGWIIKFSVSNKSDRIDYTLLVSDNGSTTMNITSTNRQPISFQGELVEIEKK